MTQGYNGWTNYETWRVNLEMFDGYDATATLQNMGADSREEMVEGLAVTLEGFAYEVLELPENGFVQSIVGDFLRKVDWEEIAEHMVDDYLAENPIEEVA